jgi:hypothetical protein
MELITEKVRIQEAVDLLATYAKDSLFGNVKQKAAVAKALKRLDVKVATIEDIAAIAAGSDSWCAPIVCDECGECVKAAVTFDADAYTVMTLCRSCLMEALDVLDSNSTED